MTDDALLLGYAALLRWVPVPGAGGPVLTPELSWPVWADGAPKLHALLTAYFG